MPHWEDFGASNARRILNRYADQVCTFNDDMQGTAAVVLAAAFSAVRAAGQRMRDQRVVIHGAGTAGWASPTCCATSWSARAFPPRRPAGASTRSVATAC